jgi:hypothetical protein
MNIWVATGWGLAGGLCVEGLELYTSIRSAPNWNWRKPISQGLMAYLVSVMIRVGVGAVLAAASTGSGQVSGPLAALGLGTAAPVLIEKLARAYTVPAAGVTVDDGTQRPVLSTLSDTTSLDGVKPSQPLRLSPPSTEPRGDGDVR